jgi:hypothetical protein
MRGGEGSGIRTRDVSDPLVVLVPLRGGAGHRRLVGEGATIQGQAHAARHVINTHIEPSFLE